MDIVKVCLFGAGWGIGGVLFGLGCKKLIAVPYCSVPFLALPCPCRAGHTASAVCS